MFWFLLFVDFMGLTFMIRIMHIKAIFDSWNRIQKSHWENYEKEISRQLHEANLEDKIEFFRTQSLRVEMFGKSTWDMMHLGYDMWVDKIWKD